MTKEIVTLEKRASSHRWLSITWFLIGAVTASSVFFGYCLWNSVDHVLKDPYAVWQTAGMVVEYMEKNQNRWPTSWVELGKTRQGPYASDSNFTLEQLRQLVVIDWNAVPKQLAKAEFNDDDQPPFRVIWLRNGRSMEWSRAEPNRIILEYLKKKGVKPDS